MISTFQVTEICTADWLVGSLPCLAFIMSSACSGEWMAKILYCSSSSVLLARKHRKQEKFILGKKGKNQVGPLFENKETENMAS
jgi:hypothetical protein